LGEKEPEISVTVIRRREVTTYPKIGQAVVNVLVTYVAAGLPPGTVTIPKDKYSVDLEKDLIRKDIQDRLQVRPESYKV